MRYNVRHEDVDAAVVSSDVDASGIAVLARADNTTTCPRGETRVGEW